MQVGHHSYHLLSSKFVTVLKFIYASVQVCDIFR